MIMIKYLQGGVWMLYKLKLSDIRLSMLGRTNENPPWRHSGRRVNYNHLALIVSGSCECRIANRTYDVRAGDLLYIPADKFYRLTTDDHCEYCFSCFYADYEKADENDIKGCLRELQEENLKFYLPYNDSDMICLAEYTHPDAAAYSNLLSLFTRGQSLYSTGRYLDRLMIDVYFQEMLIFASKTACSGSDQTGKYSLSLERILKYINENFTGHISPESLSERFSLSKEHICSLFRQEIEMTVSEYVNMVKLNHAIELLSNSSMNVSQISEYLGYSSVYYFSRIFKQRYGISPTRYIEKD